MDTTALTKWIRFRVYKADWQEAVGLAYDRHRTKDRSQERIQTKKDGLLHAHTIGALGEVIFSRESGLTVDANSYKRGDLCDFTFAGKSINIKTREWDNVDTLKAFLFPDELAKVDVFMLMSIGYDCRWMYFHGWLSSREIRERFKAEPFGGLQRMKVIVPASEFRCSKDLLPEMRGRIKCHRTACQSGQQE